MKLIVKYKEYVVLVLLAIILVGIVISKIITDKTGKSPEIIDELKSSVGATGDDSIYDIETEYDGRQFITVKPDIQFSTVLTGILENEQPEDDLKVITEKGSTFIDKTGIWIEPNSREKFQTLLEQTTKNSYIINEEGYLEYEKNSNSNEIDEKLETILTGDKMYIITMTGTCYILDEISGEVVEYPFEKMDPYQVYEYYESGNQKIYVLTSNENGLISQEEIIKSIVE